MCKARKNIYEHKAFFSPILFKIYGFSYTLKVPLNFTSVFFPETNACDACECLLLVKIRWRKFILSKCKQKCIFGIKLGKTTYIPCSINIFMKLPKDRQTRNL